MNMSVNDYDLNQLMTMNVNDYDLNQLMTMNVNGCTYHVQYTPWK